MKRFVQWPTATDAPRHRRGLKNVEDLLDLLLAIRTITWVPAGREPATAWRNLLNTMFYKVPAVADGKLTSSSVGRPVISVVCRKNDSSCVTWPTANIHRRLQKVTEGHRRSQTQSIKLCSYMTFCPGPFTTCTDVRTSALRPHRVQQSRLIQISRTLPGHQTWR